MSFKFLGKKPPHSMSWVYYDLGKVVHVDKRTMKSIKENAEHFRGALKEAADLLEDPTKYFQMTKHGYGKPRYRHDKIAKMLRVSAGDDEE